MKGHRQLIADKTYHVQSFDPVMDSHVIVGTMPSITSHGLKVYYGHTSNSFWWITGEANSDTFPGRPGWINGK